MESAGQFTVDLSKAVEKLGQATHPHAWLRFLIQAYVSAGASEIFLQKRGGQLWAVARGLENLPVFAHHDQLHSALFSSDMLERTWSRALTGLASQQPERLIRCRWAAGRGGICLDLLHQDPAFRPKWLPPLEETRPAVGLYIEIPSLQKLHVIDFLGYCVQFSPIPVRYKQPRMFAPEVDLRGVAWLEKPELAQGYAQDGQVSVDCPLVCDFIHPGPDPERGCLLKPAGGSEHALNAEWTDGANLSWQRPPGTLGSTSNLARYVMGEGPIDNLTWSASGRFANTILYNRGKTNTTLPMPLGHHLIVLTSKENEDWILPIQGGICLNALRGRLGVTGVGIVVSANQLPCDLTGMQLDEASLQPWLLELRQLLRRCLQHALNHPPQLGIGARTTFWRPALGAGLAGLAVGLTNGLQWTDIMWFTHAGLGGGTVYNLFAQTAGRMLPSRFGSANQRFVVERLQRALAQCEEALNGIA